MSLIDKPKPHPDVVATELPNGEAVLLHLGTQQYFSLNRTGAVVWTQLGENKTLGEIGRTLEQRFEVSLEEAEKCVIELTQELMQQNLLVAEAD